jgi:hypothetical protein
MDWFERITGFREDGYEATQSRLWVQDGRLRSTATPRSYAVGRLETPSLAELRERAAGFMEGAGATRVSCVQGDVRRMHAEPSNAGALFQVASQFNLLEMVSPSVSPEDGVTRYEWDRTQGPACAIAAGAGTIFRNYLVCVDGRPGQRQDRQIDCLADVGKALGDPDGSLWRMRNGYVMLDDRGLRTVDDRLRALGSEQLHALKGRLRIGLHWDVEVTDGDCGHVVSQAYCSALPIAYNPLPSARWHRFAMLVLEAAYEATLLAAAINRHRHGRTPVYLTRLGGGAFGNDTAWIHDAIRTALEGCRDADLDVRLVSYEGVPEELRRLAEHFSA